MKALIELSMEEMEDRFVDLIVANIFQKLLRNFKSHILTISVGIMVKMVSGISKTKFIKGENKNV